MQTILPQLCLYNQISSTEIILNSLVCNIMYKIKTKARQGDEDLVSAAGFVCSNGWLAILHPSHYITTCAKEDTTLLRCTQFILYSEPVQNISQHLLRIQYISVYFFVNRYSARGDGEQKDGLSCTANRVRRH